MKKFCKCCQSSTCLGGMYVPLSRTTQTWVCRSCIVKQHHPVVQEAIAQGVIDLCKVKSNNQAGCVYFCALKRPLNCGDRQ